MTEYHRKTSDRRIFEFERNVLHILLQNAKGSFAGDFFITGSLARLFKYDKENNAELVHTLKCYLKHNLNVTKTQEELHIARTTCLYRIQRIENITHLNLNDPDTQLYSLILFRLLGC